MVHVILIKIKKNFKTCVLLFLWENNMLEQMCLPQCNQHHLVYIEKTWWGMTLELLHSAVNLQVLKIFSQTFKVKYVSVMKTCKQVLLLYLEHEALMQGSDDMELEW